MIWSLGKLKAGVGVHRVHVATVLDKTFDGDMVSFLACYSKESREEAAMYFKSRRAYIQAGGGMAFSNNIQTVNLTLRFITGDPQ